MNMNDSMNGMLHVTAMDAIVGLAVLFSVVFLAAWLASPRMRRWVERPKFGFQAAVESYDQAQHRSFALKSSNILKGRKAPQ
jgi:hypothetical protein